MLFYSNKTEEIAFKKELDRWRKDNCNIKVIYTVSDCIPKDKTCIFGVISKDLIRTNLAELKERVFFIFGPPAMVTAMKNICIEMSLSQENIKTESFIGY
jgi:NAD(P)H-flavin reductase